MYSAYKLNKQGDNIQPWHTPFPIWNQSVVPCLVLTVASWPAYRFLRRQLRWSGIPISFKNFPVCCEPHSQRLLHSQWSRSKCFFWNSLGFSVVHQMLTIWSLVSLFSKSNLNIWKFSVYILLKPSLENFEHYFASMWDECGVEHSLALPFFLWDWNETGIRVRLFSVIFVFWFRAIYQLPKFSYF